MGGYSPGNVLRHVTRQVAMSIRGETRPLAPLSAHRLAALVGSAPVVLLLGALLRLMLAWRDLPAIDTLFFPDDAYISLGIARNIALGYGSTLGRQVLTNGYQP